MADTDTKKKNEDAPSLDKRDHREGCPAERIESYEAVRPRTQERPATPVVVTRCIDCGGETVKEV